MEFSQRPVSPAKIPLKKKTRIFLESSLDLIHNFIDTFNAPEDKHKNQVTMCSLAN